MRDRFRFRIAIFERYNDNGWEFEGFIEDNNNWHLTTCGDIASNNCYSAHYRRDNAPDNVYRVYELVFCTGSKDKHGKLVYEGDIVRLAYYDDEIKYRIGIVEWEDDGYVIVYNNAKDTKVSGCSLVDFFVDKKEIIGNIYENPELLKEVE